MEGDLGQVATPASNFMLQVASQSKQAFKVPFMSPHYF